MSNIFSAITQQILRNLGEGPICAHVGDIQLCTIKKHPTYPMLRNQTRLGRSRSTTSLRVWESVVTLAREGNQKERDTWLLIAVDLLTPHFEKWSTELARTWRYDVADIRSAMVEALIDAWSRAADGTPPKKLLDDMMSLAFTRARNLVDSGSAETCTDGVNFLPSNEIHRNDSTLTASSIIDARTIRDPEADERIRGERIGSLLQRTGAMDCAKRLHSQIRDGSRSDTHAPVINPTQVGRSWIYGKNLYYRFSDLLPKYIGFKEAAKAAGFSESQASRRSRKGDPPFRVLWMGNSRAVAVRALMLTLGIPDVILHPDDVENGASHFDS
ncbi:hypothetical protein ACIODW_08105 [Streptomyces sp. NPDC087897]|uniref:hypothetical protein n=1 Tax=Streptomyces sp. NPDC087897 TaxID=3365817 RepID=UPI0037F47BF5